jgi:hypothetical protein
VVSGVRNRDGSVVSGVRNRDRRVMGFNQDNNVTD